MAWWCKLTQCDTTIAVQDLVRLEPSGAFLTLAMDICQVRMSTNDRLPEESFVGPSLTNVQVRAPESCGFNNEDVVLDFLGRWFACPACAWLSRTFIVQPIRQWSHNFCDLACTPLQSLLVPLGDLAGVSFLGLLNVLVPEDVAIGMEEAISTIDAAGLQDLKIGLASLPSSTAYGQALAGHALVLRT